MNRKDFTKKFLAMGVCPFLLGEISFNYLINDANEDEAFKKLNSQKNFIINWLSDLMNSLEQSIDKDARVKIIEACGKRCFEKHQFKKNIVVKGKGDLDKLIEAYSQNFEIWKDDNWIHIRYGEKSPGCFCPVAKDLPISRDDIHCECTKATHSAIFEAALGKPFEVKILESLRRGGKTCHFNIKI